MCRLDEISNNLHVFYTMYGCPRNWTSGPSYSKRWIMLSNWINLYPVDNSINFPNTYPLDSNLSGG